MSVKVPYNSTGGAGFTRSEALLTPSDLKERYLFGVDLTDESGNEMPETVFQHQINAAISYLELKLDIIIQRTDFLERYDYRATDYDHFSFLQLKKRPICEVTEFKAKFPTNQELVSYPKEWYTIEAEAGQLQLSPVEGSFSGLIITQGGSYVPLIYGARSYWPHLFEVTYTAGFDPDCIPVILNEMIGLQAAIRTFEILGDIVLGPGTANETVSLDGASTSKGLTASAMFSAYSARIESYRKQLTEYTKTVRDYYRGIPTTVL
jgi:hypothetical protein